MTAAISGDRRSMAARLARPALLVPAAFAVHQLRYLLAYGAGTGAELQRTGHAYLHSVVPWIVALIALLAGGFLRALGRAFSGQTSPARFSASFSALCVACSAALLAIFICQEFLEGVFATGHPAGLAGIFSYGGWCAIPAAISIGTVIAAVLHGACWVVGEVARLHRRRIVAPRPLARCPRPPAAAFVAGPAPIAAGWSGRGPPG